MPSFYNGGVGEVYRLEVVHAPDDEDVCPVDASGDGEALYSVQAFDASDPLQEGAFRQVFYDGTICGCGIQQEGQRIVGVKFFSYAGIININLDKISQFACKNQIFSGIFLWRLRVWRCFSLLRGGCVVCFIS